MESHLLEMGEMACVKHVLAAGFDSAPLYAGLPSGMCPCEHWCYLARGRLRYRFADGGEATFEAGEAFHLRAGHLADVLEDAELIELTRLEEYREKREHLAARVVEDARSGEQVVFRRVAAETGGELLEMDDFWAAPDHRTHPHVHPGMEERWHVVAGEVCFRIGGREEVVGPGGVAIAPPGVRHEAWNVGDGPVQLRIEMRPALRWQEFVERLFAGEEPAGLLAEFEREVAP